MDMGFDRCPDAIDATYVMQNTWKQFRDMPHLVPVQHFVEQWFVRTMPNSVMDDIQRDITKKCNLILSNMPSSLKAKWVFSGCQVDWVSLVSCELQQPFVSLVTHHDTVKVAISADKGAFPESKQLLDAIVREMTTTP